ITGRTKQKIRLPIFLDRHTDRRAYCTYKQSISPEVQICWSQIEMLCSSEENPTAPSDIERSPVE
ncbi:MAG: hypothetical protein ACXU9G_05625, partial [Syntrophales bacterium]